MTTLTFGSVCSGIEAASVAWHPLGWRAAWLAEIEPFPSAVLAHRYPDVPNLGDMTTIAQKIRDFHVEAPDVLVGGTPCQAFSIAGLRNSMADARGQLTLSFVDLANAIDAARTVRHKSKSIIVWENVPGVLNTADNAFGCFAAALAGEDDALLPPGGKWANAGFVYGPQRTVAWRVLDAQYFGVAQRRRRVYVVASARKDFDPLAVLFEFDGVRRDTAPSRLQEQDLAGTLASRTTGGGFPGTDEACSGYVQVTCVSNAEGSPGQVPFLTASNLGKMVNNQTPLMALAYAFQPRIARNGRGDMGDLVNALTAQAGETGKGDAAPCVAYAIQAGATRTNPASGPDGVGVQETIAYTLEARAEVQAVAFSCKDHGQDALTELAPTMRAMGHAASHANAGGQLAVAFKASHFTRGKDGAPNTLIPPLSADADKGDQDTLVSSPGMAVRRLTPRECERLQGFPDDWTLVPVRNKPAADGPRYKALGNSMAVPVMAWLGTRIHQYNTVQTPTGEHHAQKARETTETTEVLTP